MAEGSPVGFHGQTLKAQFRGSFSRKRSPILEPVVQNKQDSPEDIGYWELRKCDRNSVS
ncbi:hypothetical protein H6F98_00895 [Microcoleus sp. FACHB-SPT15]|uniref:hypothetical protein n=1 Tax=Microcoleus sp. FACHB-SPT15 TaxID=2692830 RepID=UPI00177E34C2|nr:hypothetical protein [Microcoleus sp. FACHB-SPT15]MBD1804031.1 hypothetical protein [Microcoleus sp. FACHB-SPT15]